MHGSRDKVGSSAAHKSKHQLQATAIFLIRVASRTKTTTRTRTSVHKSIYDFADSLCESESERL